MRPAGAAALLLLAAGCFRPAISRLPRDRGPHPAPTWDWDPEKGEVHELPLPPGARWMSGAQEDLRRELQPSLAAGETLLVAVYEVDASRDEVERFYADVYRVPRPEARERETSLAARDLLPDLRLTGDRPVRIEAVKRLPAGVGPPDRGPDAARSQLSPRSGDGSGKHVPESREQEEKAPPKRGS